MYLFAIIVIAIVALFGIIFGAQNSGTIELHFLGKTFFAPLISVLIVAFGSGVVVAFIVAIVDEIRLKTKISTLQREINRLKKELSTMKTMPIEGERKDGG